MMNLSQEEKESLMMFADSDMYAPLIKVVKAISDKMGEMVLGTTDFSELERRKAEFDGAKRLERDLTTALRALRKELNNG